MVIDWLVTTALWCLGLVFAYSGAFKLRDLRLAALTLVDFRVTVRPRVGAAVALCAYELALAVVLFSAIAGLLPSRIPAALAMLTLMVFSLFIVRSLRAGADFACNCFGASSESISGGDVARNATLALAAAGAAVGKGTVDQSYVPSAPISAAAVLFSAWLLSNLFTLRGINADPLGDDLKHWERRIYGS